MDLLGTLQSFGIGAWFYGVVFILVLSLLVFVHEMGHYMVARMCGVRVETFSIGFGKEIKGFNDSHGTRWRISMIPLGGYVQLYGDVDPASAKHIDVYKDEQTGQVMHRDTETGKVQPFTEEDRAVSFFAKSLWRRSAVVFAGPAINYIFAIIVLAGIFSFNGKPTTPPSASAIMAGSSAEQAGFKPHDLVIEIDGKEVDTFGDIRRSMMIGLDEVHDFKVERNGKIIELQASPTKVSDTDHFGFTHSRGLLGLISPQQAISLSSIREIGTKKFEEGAEIALIRKALLKRMGKETNIVVTRGDGQDVLIIQPILSFNDDLKTGEGELSEVLIISSVERSIFVKYGPVEAVVAATVEAKDITLGTLKSLGQMITGTRSAKELGGIVRIGALAGDMAKQGIVALSLFAALLSINLGLINLMPIPLLDGGHLVFYAFEAILGKPVPDQIQEYAFRGGMVFLICVMVFANINDVIQLVL